MARFRSIWKLEPGDEAPDFRLMSTGDGAGRGGPFREISLSSLRGKSVVLAFYPAAFTSV
jgi:peroxiredoxin